MRNTWEISEKSPEPATVYTEHFTGENFAVFAKLLPQIPYYQFRHWRAYTRAEPSLQDFNRLNVLPYAYMV